MLQLAELMQLPELGIDTSGEKSKEALTALTTSICKLAAHLVCGSKACLYLLNENDELHKVASTFSPLMQVTPIITAAGDKHTGSQALAWTVLIFNIQSVFDMSG